MINLPPGALSSEAKCGGSAPKGKKEPLDIFIQKKLIAKVKKVVLISSVIKKVND